MQNKIGFPEVCTLHGIFAQGRMRPETITIFKDWTRLTTSNYGEIKGDPLEGFFCAETQLLSKHRLLVNGRPLVHQFSVQLSSNEWTTVGAVLSSGQSGNLSEGTIPKGTIEVRVLRKVGRGMSETIYIRNNGEPRQKVAIGLTLICPIRDLEFQEEMKENETPLGRGLKPRVFKSCSLTSLSFKRKFGRRRTSILPWGEKASVASFPKEGDLVVRELDIKILHERCLTRVSTRGIFNHVVEIEATSELKARDELRLELKYEPTIDGIYMGAPSIDGLAPLPRGTPEIPRESIQIHSSHSTLNLILGQALVDLESLKLPIFGKANRDEQGKYMALSAGVPRYIGLFGRDNVIAAKQSALLAPHYLDTCLSRLGALQGKKFDSWRDEEPDRMPHEQRLDPNAATGKANRDIYFGDVTSTPYWILTLAALYHWEGDIESLKRHRTTLERCCRWILRRLKEGDGFIYYKSKAPKSAPSNRNQAWKDSGDAIVDEMGRIRTPPLALVEIQAYAYWALNEAAEMLAVLGCPGHGIELRDRAQALKAAFDERFWIAEMGSYALALDADGCPIRTKASNVGHCLGSGILRKDTIGKVIEELLAEDLYSGWGIRTLSQKNPSFDPLSYHRGAVWPVENAIIADGMGLLGYREEANQIITSQLSLAALFQHMRLPEVFGGQTRTTHSPAPGIYGFANLLQAWSVSALSQFTITMLGLRPRVDRGELIVDPHLPEWLSWIDLKRIKFGRSQLALRAWRTCNGKTEWEASCSDPALRIRAHSDARSSLPQRLLNV